MLIRTNTKAWEISKLGRVLLGNFMLGLLEKRYYDLVDIFVVKRMLTLELGPAVVDQQTLKLAKLRSLKHLVVVQKHRLFVSLQRKSRWPMWCRVDSVVVAQATFFLGLWYLLRTSAALFWQCSTRCKVAGLICLFGYNDVLCVLSRNDNSMTCYQTFGVGLTFEVVRWWFEVIVVVVNADCLVDPIVWLNGAFFWSYTLAWIAFNSAVRIVLFQERVWTVRICLIFTDRVLIFIIILIRILLDSFHLYTWFTPITLFIKRSC